jgi:hypothetical protein
VFALHTAGDGAGAVKVNATSTIALGIALSHGCSQAVEVQTVFSAGRPARSGHRGSGEFYSVMKLDCVHSVNIGL